MRSSPTLSQELIATLAIVFAGAVVVAVVGTMLLLPGLETPGRVALYLTLLLVADVVVFAVFGRWLVRSRVLDPLSSVITEVESIAGGELDRQLPVNGPAELNRLADAVHRMSERLVRHQEQLAENIRSLEQTNLELTEARDELVRAEKMASVGRLAAGIAHEVGNPLGAIMGYLGLLKRSDDDKQAELAESAEREARRIDRIVRGLLDFARRRETKPRPIAVNGVVRQVAQLLEDQGRLKAVDVELALEDDVANVVADPYQLEQVLVNLFLNACDAMESAGTEEPALSVRTSPRRYEPPSYTPARRKDDPPGTDYSHRRRFNRPARPTPENRFDRGAHIVELEIMDNGPGIPTELLTQIFEPFVTTKEPGRGTGLGLAVSAGLVDAMGGTIEADNNRDGPGARFRILLPAAEAEATVDEVSA